MFARKNIAKPDSKKQKSSWIKKMGMIFLVIVCVAGVGYAGHFLIIKTQAALGYLSNNTIDIVSDTFWSPMVKDAYGNINVLLVWIGGENHDGGMLADAIIIASWNPKLKSVSMISIPRDLYIDMTTANIRGRINQAFATAYYNNGRDLHIAAQLLAEEVEEITSINAQYYAVVDFSGFKNIIDMIWGIEIDVQERIYDTTYPNERNRWYITFHVERWLQMMDGDTALKYARSRHSSSDFARSARQQQIIEATLKEVLRKENIQNVSTIRKLYDEYSQMVTTNITNREIVGMIKHIFALEHMFNFWLTSVCSNRWRQVMSPWCFLYTPNREWFGGASVLLANGSSYRDLSFYDYTRNFGHIVAQNQWFLIEKARINVLNGIDKSYAQQARKWADGHATQIAVKLRKYGFTITGAGNAPETQTGTTVTISGPGNYKNTIQMLEKFFPIDEVIVARPEKIIQEDGSEVVPEIDADITITLGNNYIDYRPAQFNYNM
jgi:LCP family protein required for cell wall assembly